MNQKQIEDIVRNVDFRGEKFVIMPKCDGYLLQLTYYEADVDKPDGPPILQKGRKWYISSYATESEIVQTCLLACLTSMEHRTREHFKYRGYRLFGPHIDIHAHIDASSRTEHRVDPRLQLKPSKQLLKMIDEAHDHAGEGS